MELINLLLELLLSTILATSSFMHFGNYKMSKYINSSSLMKSNYLQNGSIDTSIGMNNLDYQFNQLTIIEPMGTEYFLCMSGLETFLLYRNKQFIKLPSCSTYEYGCETEDGIIIIGSVNNKYGLINKYGDWITDPIFDEICGFDNGYSICILNDKVGLINSLGCMVIPCLYESVSLPSENYSVIGYEDVGSKWTMALISITDGSVLITGEFCYPFSDGLALVAPENGSSFIIDIEGNKLLEQTNDCHFVGQQFCDGLLRVSSNGKYGYLDRYLNCIIPCKFDFATDFCDGYAEVRNGSNTYIIDTYGHFIKGLQNETVYLMRNGWIASVGDESIEISKLPEDFTLEFVYCETYGIRGPSPNSNEPLLLYTGNFISFINADGSVLHRDICTTIIRVDPFRHGLATIWISITPMKRIWIDASGNIVFYDN